jgi:TRPM family ion channel
VKYSGQRIRKQELIFPNSNRAQLVAPPSGTRAADILQALGIEKPKGLIVILGGAANLDDALMSPLVQLFSRGIAPTAARLGAAIIDGGTQAGVMAIMGQGVADRGRKSVLLGVAPAGKVTYPGRQSEGSVSDSTPLDPNHTHFVLVESNEWGGETDTMFQLAQALAEATLVLVVLANGGTIAKGEVLRSVRQGWPIIVVEGSGGLANEIAELYGNRRPFPDDPVLAEIVTDGNIHLIPLSGSIGEIERLIAHQFEL